MITAGIYVETDGMLGHKARVYYIDKNGTSTEISDCVSGLDFNLNVNELNTVTIKAYANNAKILALIEKTEFEESKGLLARARRALQK